MSDLSDAFAFPPCLRLALEPGLGPALARALLAECGSGAAVYAATPSRLAPLTGPGLARQLAAPPSLALRAEMAAVQAWLAQPGQHGVAWDDADYPPLLRHIPDPPVWLYVVGNRAALSRPGLAIVGARQGTAGGLETAEGFARHLAVAGWTIVSGLASGIDAAAHAGALAAGALGGGTLAVLGTGADLVYPARHRRLAADMVAAGGALVTELPLGTPPRPAHFPRRNRLVAGMTRGVLVVEAALQSGSLITARLAADLGREVFAIPGSIHAPLSRGCHALIRQGAKLTETVADIVDELGPGHQPALDAPGVATTRAVAHPSMAAPGSPQRSPQMSPQRSLPTAPDGLPAAMPTPPSARATAVSATAEGETPPRSADGLPAELATVLNVLGFDPVLVDDVQRRAGLPAAAIQAALLHLELAGHVRRSPGGRFERVG